MLILVIFAFIAGIVTILSPCILPVLPIVLSGSLGGGKKRPIGVVTGFVASFTFFTLFLTLLVRQLGIPADSLRNFSIIIIFLFGLSLVVPGFQKIFEKLFAKLSKLTPSGQNKHGFLGGFVIGVSIGLIWTPCVGPILGSVISLALTGTVTGSAFFITLAYSLGTAIPMLAIVWGGRGLLNKVPWLTENTGKIQKIFGVVMILTAIGIYYNVDRRFQAYILDKFPQYGAGLTQFEDNDLVEEQLDRLRGGGGFEKSDMGKPMFELLEDKGAAPELIQGGRWFNTSASSVQNLPELTDGGMALESLRGNVVLIDFWTYTCINCIRTLPYLRGWHEKYSDDGLVIIGVHTPEFEFEKSADNLQGAINDFELEYPIMQDNDYETWRAYNNRYWPAKYLIDKDGNIRYMHFGEGAYDETEEVIQTLLAETGKSVDEEIQNPNYSVQTLTPEIYLGFGRMQYYFRPAEIRRNEAKEYGAPASLQLNRFAFDGEWLVGEEYSNPTQDSSLHLRFSSKDVFLVMRPQDAGSGEVEVYLDGQLVGESQAGEDVGDGVVEVGTDRLYELIQLNEPGEHTLELRFLDSNLQIFAFTFG